MAQGTEVHAIGGCAAVETESCSPYAASPERRTDSPHGRRQTPGGTLSPNDIDRLTMSGSIVQCQICGRKNRVPAAASGTPRCGQCKSPLPWITDAGDDSFAEIAEASAIPVLVDLWAPWCGPCRMVSPALEQLARERAGQLKLVKVNVDDAPNLSRRFSAQAIPTLVLMVGGREVARQVGAAPEHALRNWLDQSRQGSRQ
jgi:thioredoxin 2